MASFLQRDSETTETQLPNVPISDSFGSGDKCILQRGADLHDLPPKTQGISALSLEQDHNSLNHALLTFHLLLFTWSSLVFSEEEQRREAEDVRIGNLQLEDIRHCFNTAI